MRPVAKGLVPAVGLWAVVGCVQLSFVDRPCPTDGCPDGLVCVRDEDDVGVCRRPGDVDAGTADAGGADGGAVDGGSSGDGGAGTCAPPCGLNEVCDAGQCVARDCGTVTCGPGQVCANGGCVNLSCGGTTCAAGAGCIDDECRHLACAFVRCPPASACSPAGRCAPTACPDAGACAAGLVCPATACEDLRCAGLSCAEDAGFPPLQRCVEGACVPCTGGTPEDCDNLTDDDCDGLTDCADPDCETMSCNDQDGCTQGESCQAGACGGGAAVRCTQTSDGCREQMGACNTATGGCEFALLPATTPCNDGNGCTVGDQCGPTGRCDVNSGLKACPPSDAGCRQAVCQPSDGGCVDVTTPGASCNTNRCLTGQVCDMAGVCTGGVDANPCGKDAGADPECAATSACDPVTGGCLVQSMGCTPANPCVLGACQWTAGSPVLCLESSGRLPDGQRVGNQVCCAGAPTSLTSTLHCGGCGLACSLQRACVAQTCAIPNRPTGACECTGSTDCPKDQACTGGVCRPSSANQCAATGVVTMCAGGAACDYP